jgi:hypothetical protein
MEPATVDKRNSEQTPRLCAQEVTVGTVYLDQRKRLK